MLPRGFFEYLSKLLKSKIKQTKPISGGDISQAYKVTTQNGTFFLKTNKATNALDMFKAEALGLDHIGQTKTIKSPKVLYYNIFQNTSFLIMDFIESKSPSHDDFKNLGLKLAQLHQSSKSFFGLEHDNFIGSLPQSNNPHRSWIDFYTNQRLLPQLELAKQSGLLNNNDCPSTTIIINNLELMFKNIKPALLHGDLWSGNYLISKEGIPYLIDPAVYYGHHEVDIAMSKLFGGFGSGFYNAYHSLFPKDSNTEVRIEIYQLYYLLVHLNLFGRSYYQSVKTILKKYF